MREKAKKRSCSKDKEERLLRFAGRAGASDSEGERSRGLGTKVRVVLRRRKVKSGCVTRSILTVSAYR